MTPLEFSAPWNPGLSLSLWNHAAADPGSWQQVFDHALAADIAGIDRVIVTDHVVFGENLEAYGRSELGGWTGGKQPTGPDGQWLEPLTVLSVISGMTSRVRLTTGILQAALRRPVVLAKTAATLDVLSGGRLELGVGVGWQREEYEAAGLDFATRGRILNQTLAICQELWRNAVAEFHSEDLQFSSIHCEPKPLQPKGVPIWVSGTANRRVIDRIVRFGSGWIPWGPDQLDPIRSIAAIREALVEANRDIADFSIRGILPLEFQPDGSVDVEKTMHQVPLLVNSGITDFNLRGHIPSDRHAATEFLSELVVGFREVLS